MYGQRLNDPVYGQMSYNGCLSNSFKLKLLFVEMNEASGKDIVEKVF
jgi:hypothetical protein